MNSIIYGTLGAVGNTVFALYRAALFTRMIMAWGFALVILALVAGITLQAIWGLIAR